MALPYDTTRTLPRLSPVRSHLSAPTVRLEPAQGRTAPPPATARLRAVATSPTTALVVMLLGLTLLFVLPVVGLPFVALVVLRAVVYHLRAEGRSRLRRPAR